jgi:hypothetical protein
MDTVRADQIGSLLRPGELLQAWGRCSPDSSHQSASKR